MTSTVLSIQNQSLFQSAGATAPDLQTGSVGTSPRNVPILFLNGARHSYEDCKAAAKRVSDVFAGAQVHFAHIPLTLWDVARSVVWNRPKTLAGSLAKVIRSHLQPSRPLLIIAHSGGANVLAETVPYLTASERGRIDVATFGSCTWLHRDKFRKVMPFVGKTDIAARFAQLITGGIRGLVFHPQVIGSWESPLASHRFLTDANLHTIATIAADHRT